MTFENDDRNINVMVKKITVTVDPESMVIRLLPIPSRKKCLCNAIFNSPVPVEHIYRMYLLRRVWMGGLVFTIL